MIRTYLDAGVLIIAARGVSDASDGAIRILADRDRQFVASGFLRLEVLPKAVYNQQPDEAVFYEDFFRAVVAWTRDDDAIVRAAYQLACTYGLAGMDALHVAAALALHADELVTTEKLTKPMHRVPLLRIVSIHPEAQGR